MCNSQDDYISFEVKAPVSGICILDFDMSLAEFGALVSGPGRVKPKGSLRGLDKIGKKCVRENRTIDAPGLGVQLSSLRGVAERELL